MQKRVSFSSFVVVRQIEALDPMLKSSMFYNAEELRQIAHESNSAMEKKRRELEDKTNQLRERTAKILERRRARHAVLQSLKDRNNKALLKPRKTQPASTTTTPTTRSAIFRNKSKRRHSVG